MGQPVQVVRRRVLRPGVVRYEIDRSLTGTDHEFFASADDAAGERPPDVLASRLFATGSVHAVHVFSNAITITFSADDEPGTLDELQTVIETLFIHYRPGVLPQAI